MEIYNQKFFNNLLCLERKRSERTGQPFGLALLDIAHIPDAFPLLDVMAKKMRETDITGWYRNDSILGVIFTSFNGAEVLCIRARLKSKIDNVMKAALPENDRRKVPITLHIYPEDVVEDLYPDMDSSSRKDKSNFHTIKRTIDISLCLMAMIVFLPVFAGIAILIKLTSRGPIFFKQKRMGLWGKQFDFLKFRSMYTNNDPEIHKEYVKKLIENQQDGSAGVYKIQNDPRIIPLGRFLRKFSLDELPQFINVLKGEMSIVGPRPPIPYEVDNYQCWHRRRIIEVKPGITGLWQVRGRSRTTFDEMVRLDLQYLNEQSILLDLKIILATPRAMFIGSGAY